MATFRKCPYCKSNKGFEVIYILGGTHTFQYTFNGKVISNIREGSDTIDNYAICLDCKRLIEIEKLKIP